MGYAQNKLVDHQRLLKITDVFIALTFSPSLFRSTADGRSVGFILKPFLFEGRALVRLQLAVPVVTEHRACPFQE